MADSDTGPITQFPADDLRPAKRFITSHNAAGQGVFVGDDNGDHHRVMVRGKGVANIIYSTISNPVDLNNEVDIAYARENEVNSLSLMHPRLALLWARNATRQLTRPANAEKPGIHVPHGSVVRLIDFAPGVESPLHRALSIDYGVVIQGEFELTLDSGESRMMYPGDVSVNRGAMHKWRNVDADKSGRMLFVLLDCKPLFVEGKEIVQDLGALASEYADLGK
ncbi:hypothetical protein MMC31_000177 [Peltigera leucophlebia]|nr:hypothetical protein [Peltigera leucophlebia]